MIREPDFAMVGIHEVDDEAGLREVFESQKTIRLAGAGGGQHLIPSPAADGAGATVVSTVKLNRILRLEADDLTCTVEAGVTREQLEVELVRHKLALPCAGEGTLAGIFAGDHHGPTGPGGYSPRSLLLGFEGMLAEGLSFKAGSRVVKSVAGFDIPKLFVGSRGRLFGVLRLHLKLRPRPRYEEHFANTGLDPRSGLELFQRLRSLPVPPTTLVLHIAGQEATVHGTLGGIGDLVRSTLTALALEADRARALELAPDPSPDNEIVQAVAAPSVLPGLLPLLTGREALLLGGGRMQLRCGDAAESDHLLATLADRGIAAWVQAGPVHRRGLSNRDTPEIHRGLKQALDPGGILV